MSDLIEKAMKFATLAHGDQVRKYGGELYINHPRRVAATLERIGCDNRTIATGWLHDVIEDCGVTFETIREKFGATVAWYVWGMTDQAPKHWKRIIRKSWEAGRLSMCYYEVQTCKLADIKDNSESIIKYDPNFAKIYIPEKEVVVTSLTKGHKDLREEVLEQLDWCKKQLGVPTL